MKIKRIKFQNYTVFEDQQMEFSPGINVIIGENGTGKTHLMFIIPKFHCPWQPVSPIIDQEVVEPLGVRYSKPGIKVLRILRGQTP